MTKGIHWVLRKKYAHLFWKLKIVQKVILEILKIYTKFLYIYFREFSQNNDLRLFQDFDTSSSSDNF